MKNNVLVVLTVATALAVVAGLFQLSRPSINVTQSTTGTSESRLEAEAPFRPEEIRVNPKTATSTSPSAPRAARKANAAPLGVRKSGATAGPADTTISGGKASPLPANFLDKLLDADGKTAHFALPDGRNAAGTAELVRHDDQGVLLVQGRLTQPAGGFFFFQRQTVEGVAGPLVGNVRFDNGDLAFRVEPTGPGGTPVLAAQKVDKVVCVNYNKPDPKRMAAAGLAPAENPQNAPQTHPINIPIPAYQNGVVPLQSLPGATCVIYLDFDGEKGPFSGWGSFDAAPSGANNDEIKEVWQRVAEDYQPFNINITTDRKVFDNAQQGRRQHCILTPTTTAAPGAGGVSYISSFNWSGDTVNWSFYSTGKAAAEVVSHECGHALGLGHDGRTSPSEDYYGGQGSGEVGWAPIMGVGYYVNLVQWSKGQYANPSNTQDDLNIIVTDNNNVDYRTDDASATFATAPYLEILANDTVSNEGIIETAADVDAFRFTTAGGAVSLTANVVSQGPNLDILAEIYTSANVLVASNNPDTGLSTTVATNLAAGDYTFRVSGVGRGDPLTTGYTDYASLGAYLITGSVTGGVKPDRFTIAENSANGSAVGTVTPRNAHDANPLAYAITSGNTGGAFAINASTGAVTVANTAQLNYETLSLRWDDPATFQIFVSITDATNPTLNESVRVVVDVTDVNELPAITGGAVTIPEHARAGTNVFKVTGSDPDRYEFPTFSIVAGNTGNAFTINGTTGQITVANDTEATTTPSYTLTVRATDHGTPALTKDATVTVTVINIPAGYQPGAVVRTFYENITGNNVTDLTGNAAFPNSPSSQQNLTSFDGGSEHGDNYGDTIRGFLIPPTTGNYTFWIASDDGGELRISTNANPASAVVRATVANATNQYQYNANGSQQSIALSLTAGTPYYIEARHKEGGGGDHVAVAWQGPGITQQVIPGTYLALQSLDLISPKTTNANIPTGTGIAIALSNAGRTGTTFAWTKVSGPGTVTFDNATALATGASFSVNGNYLLRCTETGATTPISLDLTVNAGVVGNDFIASKVGDHTVEPSVALASGAYTLTSAGTGIPSSGMPDGCYFLNIPATGNLTVTARVVSVQNTDGSNSRAGVMIRESLAEDALQAFCGVTAANGSRFIYRTTAATNNANASGTVTQPYWVRLIRASNSFTAQVAPDSNGTPGTFSALGTTQTIAMSSDVLVGIAATSGSPADTGNAVIDHVTITPTIPNVGPSVNAGVNASVTYPAAASLNSTVTDDAKPAPPAVATTWSKTSGPGNVTFGDAAVQDTSADFSVPGPYVLRLTADDGAVRTFEEVTITSTAANTVTVTASDVNASEQGPNTGQFTFTRTGPTTGALTVNFTVAGTAVAADYAALPATVVIPDGAASAPLVLTPTDDAAIEGSETVILSLSAGFYNIGGTGNATITISDNDVAPTVTITSPTAPVVNIPAGVGVVLEAGTTDDGFPNPLALTWSKVSGPGTVTFAPANTANTAATFSATGIYVLRLTANDGQFTASDDVTIGYGKVDNAFTDSKVGTQSVTPSFAQNGTGTYTMTAAGTGIPSGNVPDDFYFLNTTVTGDVTITARLVSVQNTNGSNSRAGVMIRNSLAADTLHAFCGINSQSSGRWIYRLTAGANSENAQATAAFPYWVRLIRSGDTFTAQFAPDSGGTPGTFTTAGTPQTIAMGSSVFAGLATTSGSGNSPATAVFDNVSITPVPVNVGASVNAGSDASNTLPANAALDGTVTDDGKPAPFTTAWSKVSGPGNVAFGNASTIDTTASFTVAGGYTLRLTANDGQVKTFDEVAITVQGSPIEQWRTAHFGANAGNPAIAGDLADPDFDGLPNVLEYGLDLDPLVPGASGIVIDLETIGADQFLRLTAAKNPAATDVVFSVEVTGTIGIPASWTTSGTTIETNTSTQLKVRDNTPVSSSAQRSIRLKVTHP